MKTYTDREKLFILKILEERTATENKGLRKFEQILFDTEEWSLLLIENEEESILLSRDSRYTSDQTTSLIDTLSILKFLEENGYICSLPQKGYQSLFFYHSQIKDATVTVPHEKYECALGFIFQKRDGVCWMESYQRKKMMTGVLLPKDLTRMLKRYFASSIYPTSKLVELKEQNFKSLEEIYQENQLKEANRNLKISWSALFVSLLMPVFAIFLNNCWGISTIQEPQYQGIVNTINEVKKEIRHMKGEKEQIQTKKIKLTQ